MPKINHEEYEVLKGLDDKWEWIARDEAQQTYAYEYRPIKSKLRGQWESNWNDYYLLPHDWLQFIQWEDEEPYNIAELIEEYEKDYKGSWEHAIEFSGEVFGESEETEVKKDIEWLKEEIEEDIESWGGGNPDYFRGANDAYDNVKDWLDQLDEPEVLSQEWIDKYKVDYDNWMPAVPIVHLQNLLVPKREVSMIPNYVAKWISEHHEQFDLYPALKRLENNMSSWENVYEWYRENTRNFVNAYLTGEYEIEQEPKYYAKIKGHENIGSNDKYWNYNTDMEELSIGDSEVHPNVISEYTIKATKDEWANLGINDDNADFAKVEELEE